MTLTRGDSRAACPNSSRVPTNIAGLSFHMTKKYQARGKGQPRGGGSAVWGGGFSSEGVSLGGGVSHRGVVLHDDNDNMCMTP